MKWDRHALNCDPRGDGLPVVYLKDKRLYAMILPMNNCPRKYNANAGESGLTGDVGGMHLANQSIRRGELSPG